MKYQFSHTLLLSYLIEFSLGLQLFIWSSSSTIDDHSTTVSDLILKNCDFPFLLGNTTDTSWIPNYALRFEYTEFPLDIELIIRESCPSPSIEVVVDELKNILYDNKNAVFAATVVSFGIILDTEKKRW
jgi:hypothetical protein